MLKYISTLFPSQCTSRTSSREPHTLWSTASSALSANQANFLSGTPQASSSGTTYSPDSPHVSSAPPHPKLYHTTSDPSTPVRTPIASQYRFAKVLPTPNPVPASAQGMSGREHRGTQTASEIAATHFPPGAAARACGRGRCTAMLAHGNSSWV